MQHGPGHWTTDELLAQSGWLCELARRLVADPSEADDLAQETWVAALKRPPERDRPLRPWLARVARNFARMRRRSEAARAVRESSRASGGDSPGPAELSERLEGQRLLIDALRELREPYRSTVLLAYFERLDSAEIARRQRVSAGTVRWRLSTAIAELRTTLDARHEGRREAWAISLAPLARSKVATPAAVVSQGALWMSAWTKVGVAAAALVAVVFVVTRSGLLGGGESEPALAMEPMAVTFAEIAEPVAPAREVLEPAREPSSETSTNPAVESPDPEPFGCAFEVSFADESGNAIAGVEIVFTAFENSEMLAGRSGSGGHVRVEIPGDDEPTDIEFVCRAPGWASRAVQCIVRPGETTYLGTLTLARGGDIAGRVVDSDGRPLAGATVLLRDLDVPQSELRQRGVRPVYPDREPFAWSSDDGSFTFRGAPAGMNRLVAGLEEFEPTYSAPIEVRAGQETRGVELVLAPLPAKAMFRGVVLDPNGTPVPRAKMSYRYSTGRGSGSGTFNAGDDGRFELRADHEAPHSFVANDSGELWGAAQASDVEPGGPEIVLRLTLPLELEIVVRSASGAPVEHFEAIASAPDSYEQGGRTSAGPHAGGRARFAPKLQRMKVEVRATGFELGRAGPFDAPPSDPLEFVLRPLPGVRGRATHASSGVVARIEVHRRGGGRYERNGLPARFDDSVHASATCASDGSFEVTLRESGDFTLLALADGYATTEVEIDDFEPEVGRSEVELALVRGGSIEGRVLAPRGASATGTIVAFSRGDGRGFTRRVGPEGTYRADGLAPGKWDVRAVEEELRLGESSSRSWPRGGGEELPWKCEVYDGRVTRFDLDLGGTPPVAEINVHFSIDGVAAPAWTVDLMFGDPRESRFEASSVRLDPQGRASLAADQLGPAWIVATAIGGELDGLRLVQPFTVRSGRNALDTNLDTARVRIERASLEPPLAVLWLGDGGRFALRPVLAAGTSELTVPAGTLRLWRATKDASNPDPSTWPAIDATTVEPGASATLDAGK